MVTLQQATQASAGNVRYLPEAQKRASGEYQKNQELLQKKQQQHLLHDKTTVSEQQAQRYDRQLRLVSARPVKTVVDPGCCAAANELVAGIC